MRNAISRGIFPGILLGVILIALMLIRTAVVKHSNFSHITFTVIFIAAVVTTLVMAIRKNIKKHFRWRYFITTAITCSLIAAFLFSAGSYIYARDISPNMLQELWGQANAFLGSRNLGTTIQWDWLKNPLNFALNNLQALLIILTSFSLIVSTAYFYTNRKQVSQSHPHDDHQLIF